MSIEAMKQALEALEDVQEAYGNHSKWFKDRVDALRQAIEQAEHVHAVNTSQERVDEMAKGEHEPVAWMYVNKDGECEQIEYGPVPDDPGVTPLYTAPPQRKPLTHEEILKVWEQAMVQDNGAHARLDNQPFVHFARAIEAAHGIKEEA